LEYNTFSLDSPATGYVLRVSSTATGDIGDALNDAGSPANNKQFQITGTVCTTSQNGFFWYTSAGQCCSTRWFGQDNGGFSWYGVQLQIFRLMLKQLN